MLDDKAGVYKRLLMLNGSNLMADAVTNRPDSPEQLAGRYTLINRNGKIVHKQIDCTFGARGVAGSCPHSGVRIELQRRHRPIPSLLNRARHCHSVLGGRNQRWRYHYCEE